MNTYDQTRPEGERFSATIVSDELRVERHVWPKSAHRYDTDRCKRCGKTRKALRVQKAQEKIILDMLRTG